MKNMTLQKLAEACHGILVAGEREKNLEVEGIVIDSRLVQPGYLFVAVRGEKVDGHSFIPQVVEAQACAVVSEEPLENMTIPYIQVASSLQAIKDMAEYYRSQLTIPIVGITGSVGKTSTKEMISSVLEQRYSVLKTAGNFNNEIGLPLTMFRIRPEHQVAVLEMGISDFGEMHRLAAMAQPNICVITNIGLCHLENLKTRDGILEAKTECFAHMKDDGIAVLNGDDDKLSTIKSVNGTSPQFYGIGQETFPECKCEKNVYASDVQNHGAMGISCRIHVGEQEFDADISIPGEHNVYNALAATCVGLELGLSMEEIQRGIASAATIAGRTNILRLENRTIIDDCYNANPVSMKASIDVLEKMEGRTIAVLGDMGELGEQERELHYQVGEYIATKKIHALFTAGTLTQDLARAVKEHHGTSEVYAYEKRDQMIDGLMAYIQPGDVILVKASHFMEFPKVVEALK